MSDVYDCETNCNGLSPAVMERQSSEEEICRTAIFCGVGESFRRVIFPRTASRCCSGSTRTFRSYFAKVKASRSREKAFAPEAQRKHRMHSRRNFMFYPTMPLSFLQ